jgi:hypothetical protein
MGILSAACKIGILAFILVCDLLFYHKKPCPRHARFRAWPLLACWEDGRWSGAGWQCSCACFDKLTMREVGGLHDTGGVAKGISVAVPGSLQPNNLPHGELVEARTGALPSGKLCTSDLTLTNDNPESNRHPQASPRVA